MLLNRITTHLNHKRQVTLREILEEHPIESGLAELLTYFSIASQSSRGIRSVSFIRRSPQRKGPSAALRNAPENDVSVLRFFDVSGFRAAVAFFDLEFDLFTFI